MIKAFSDARDKIRSIDIVVACSVSIYVKIWLKEASEAKLDRELVRHQILSLRQLPGFIVM